MHDDSYATTSRDRDSFYLLRAEGKPSLRLLRCVVDCSIGCSSQPSRCATRIGHVRHRNRGIAFAANQQWYHAHKQATSIPVHCCISRRIQSRNRACLWKHGRPLSLVSRCSEYIPACSSTLCLLTYLCPPFPEILCDAITMTARNTVVANFGRHDRDPRNLRDWFDSEITATLPFRLLLSWDFEFPQFPPSLLQLRIGQGIKIASLRAFPRYSNSAVVRA